MIADAIAALPDKDPQPPAKNGYMPKAIDPAGFEETNAKDETIEVDPMD